MPDVAIAQLAKEPLPGAVKTRMQPALSTQQSAELHAAMVRYISRTLCDSGLGVVQLWVDGDLTAPLFEQCVSLGGASLHKQQGADLGARMAGIVEQCLANHSKVILVGSDAPGLSRGYLADAVIALDRVEAVVGPALDGGYVLLGLSRTCAGLFSDMPWGSDQVLAISLRRLQAAAMTFELLEPLPDIDRPEDLAHLPEGLGWTR